MDHPTPSAPASLLRRWYDWLVRLEAAFDVTHDDIQDRRLGDIERRLANLEDNRPSDAG